MVQLDTTPCDTLKTLLEAAGVTPKIYTNWNIPTSGLPKEFIEIVQNGALISRAHKRALVEGNISIIINIKLLTTGASNTVREQKLIKEFKDIFNSPLVSNGYSYKLNHNSMVYSGRAINTGYSTKIVNVNVLIS